MCVDGYDDARLEVSEPSIHNTGPQPFAQLTAKLVESPGQELDNPLLLFSRRIPLSLGVKKPAEPDFCAVAQSRQQLLFVHAPGEFTGIGRPHIPSPDSKGQYFDKMRYVASNPPILNSRRPHLWCPPLAAPRMGDCCATRAQRLRNTLHMYSHEPSLHAHPHPGAPTHTRTHARTPPPPPTHQLKARAQHPMGGPG